MKKVGLNRGIVRFRRWARKGYSIFASLGKQVSIGVLDFRIANTSLKKLSVGIASSISDLFSLEEDKDKELENEELLENELALMPAFCMNFNMEDKVEGALSFRYITEVV